MCHLSGRSPFKMGRDGVLAVPNLDQRMAGQGVNLCLAGGLGLNALLVSALETRSGFKNVFVQPAAGNAGTAIGAALETWHTAFAQENRVAFPTLCLGPAFTSAESKLVLENCKLSFRYMLTTEELIDTAVAQLSENKIVAWMHGRMEFGARGLRRLRHTRFYSASAGHRA